MELSTMPLPRPAVFSGIVTAMETPQSAVGHFFPLSLVTIPQVFLKVSSAQFLLVSKVVNKSWTLCS